jgi:hypothetical protein
LRWRKLYFQVSESQISNSVFKNRSESWLPDFSLFKIPKREEMYQNATKLPNGHKLYQIAVVYSK